MTICLLLFSELYFLQFFIFRHFNSFFQPLAWKALHFFSPFFTNIYSYPRQMTRVSSCEILFKRVICHLFNRHPCNISPTNSSAFRFHLFISLIILLFYVCQSFSFLYVFLLMCVCVCSSGCLLALRTEQKPCSTPSNLLQGIRLKFEIFLLRERNSVTSLPRHPRHGDGFIAAYTISLIKYSY